jgi:hypothetical protein
MKFARSISVLVIIIVLLSLTACIIGVFSSGGGGRYEIQSFRGETITLYGKGIYHYDSVSMAAQGKAQDVVTMVLGIPLLIISLCMSRKGSLKGRLLLTGTLGYFLYTYVSYSFLCMYNQLFLMYTALMSASFFAFTLSMMSFDLKALSSAFNKRMPVKLIGGFQIFIGIAFGMLWLGRILPSLARNTVPYGLEHYTSLTIQAMDLSFVVPSAFLSGILLIKRRPFGYLLSSVIIIKGITLSTSLTAMIIGQALAGVTMSPVDVIISLSVNLLTIYFLVLLLRNIDEDKILKEV